MQMKKKQFICQYKSWCTEEVIYRREHSFLLNAGSVKKRWEKVVLKGGRI